MIHWFKRHPELLRDDSEALSSDKNYEELHQLRNNLFVSHGNIIVRLSTIQKFPIFIAYTDAYPYSLPLIFPLNRGLSIEETEKASTLSLLELHQFLTDKIEFYYHARHQNATGSLCILELDNLENGFEFYGITSVLKRIKDWYKGLITGEFPPDSQEVELFSHFSKINETIKLLYTDAFLNQELKQGYFYAYHFGSIPKGKFIPEEKTIYFGIYFNGENEHGIIVNPNQPLPFPLNEHIRNGFDIITKESYLKSLFDDGTMIKANWFNLSIEPTPFKTFSDLILLIGNNSFQTGVERFHKNCGSEITKLPESFLLGITYPNRKGNFEFQLFNVKRIDNYSELIIQSDPLKSTEEKIKAYDTVEAIECENVSRSLFFERNGARAKSDILNEKSIAVIGVGAIGGEIADCIGKTGVGHISLIDNQILKAHNTVRHVAGFDAIGHQKVEATARIISNHNPFVNISLASYNVLFGDINEYIKFNNISISSIADDNIEGFLNEQAIIYKKPIFYVRALRGGKVGRIFRVIPGIDACFHCLNLYRSEGQEFIEIPEDTNYPTIKNECNNPIRPASAADLKIIASLTSRYVIEHLQDGPSSYNHWIWSTEIIPSTPLTSAYSVSNQFIPPHPKCCYCNHEKKLKVEIKQDQLTYMHELVKQNPNIETGGVLAGCIEDGMKISITHISGPGTNAVKTSIRFEKDEKHCQEFLDNLYKEYGSDVIYLGEWHSHPSENNSPSSTDIKSLAEIGYQKEYLIDTPVMIILSNTGKASCSIHPVGKSFYNVELETFC